MPTPSVPSPDYDLTVAISGASTGTSIGSVVISNGSLQVGASTLEVKQAQINISASGDNTVVAAVTAKKIRVVGVMFICAADVTVQVKSLATSKIAAMSYHANGGVALWWPEGFWVETASGEALVFALGGNVQVSGSLNYVEV